MFVVNNFIFVVNMTSKEQIVERYLKPKSRGGVNMDDIKKIAVTLGIPTKKMKKLALLERIVDDEVGLRVLTNIQPSRPRTKGSVVKGIPVLFEPDMKTICDPNPDKVELVRNAISTYAVNRNTGNKYEIVFAMFLLSHMGVDKNDLYHCRDLVNSIIANVPEMLHVFKSYKLQTQTMTIGGKNVVGITNATQNDEVGTGDFLLKVVGNRDISISVSDDKKSKRKLQKCEFNTSAKTFGCGDEDIEEIKRIAERAVDAYKEEMAGKYGKDETNWARRRSDTAVHSCSEVAKLVAQVFNSKTLGERIGIGKKLLRINKYKKPADYIALINPTAKNTVVLYKYGKQKIGCRNFSLVATGIYLDLYSDDVWGCRTQVKFNNGIWHKGKTSSLTSSWNVTVFLEEIYDMTETLI